jgi:hypothetical protein
MRCSALRSKGETGFFRFIAIAAGVSTSRGRGTRRNLRYLPSQSPCTAKYQAIIVAGLEPTAVGKLDAGLHADDRGGFGEAKLTGEAPVAVEPSNVLNDADAPLFDAAMALVVVDEAVEAIASAKALSVSARKLGWLALTASR